MRRHSVAAALLAGAALCGCGVREGEFSRWVDIDPRGWAYADTLVLGPDTAVAGRQAAQGRLSVAVAHGDDYPYANIWLEVDDGERRDTVCIELADVYGRWLGQGFGASYQKEADMGRRVLDPRRAVRVRHVMRLDTLPSLTRVGVKFVKE